MAALLMQFFFFAVVVATMALAARLLPAPRRELAPSSALDGLRGFLALGVCIHHGVIWQGLLQGRPWISPDWTLTRNFGDASVELFFMLSAFLFYIRVLEPRPID